MENRGNYTNTIKEKAQRILQNIDKAHQSIADTVSKNTESQHMEYHEYRSNDCRDPL